MSSDGSVLKHYLTLALQRAGVRLDSDVQVEINAVAESFDDMASRLAAAEARLDKLEKHVRFIEPDLR